MECVSRFPMPSRFLLNANEKDFSLSLEMTVRESGILTLLPSHAEGFDAGTLLSLLPMEGGAPEGAEVGSRSGIKEHCHG